MPDSLRVTNERFTTAFVFPQPVTEPEVVPRVASGAELHSCTEQHLLWKEMQCLQTVDCVPRALALQHKSAS